ncbi:MAG: GNAT family N-acetyltransferase [Anaerovoracaceae bacterium]
MFIREYKSSDCEELAQLFYNTVHTINAKDYTKAQLDVWAPKKMDLEKWNRSFANHYSIVAIEDEIIAGFGDIDMTGYLDRLYVHADYQKRGIASSLCSQLEKAVQGTIITHASITARTFFEKRGYTCVKKQQVERLGVLLNNFVMRKNV